MSEDWLKAELERTNPERVNRRVMPVESHFHSRALVCLVESSERPFNSTLVMFGAP